MNALVSPDQVRKAVVESLANPSEDIARHVLAMAGSNPSQIEKAITTGTGLVAYDLQAPAPWTGLAFNGSWSKTTPITRRRWKAWSVVETAEALAHSKLSVSTTVDPEDGVRTCPAPKGRSDCPG
jgi:hypothetical protein